MIEAKDHEFFNAYIREFNALSKLFTKMASGFQNLETTLVTLDNKSRSLDGEVQAKRVALAEYEAELKSKRQNEDRGVSQVRQEMERRHRELIEREQKVRAAEIAAEENSKRASALLAAAEAQAPRRAPVAVLQQKPGALRPPVGEVVDLEVDRKAGGSVQEWHRARRISDAAPGPPPGDPR